MQPPTGYAANGFEFEDRPPAEWLNWMFNHYGAWFDYLRGPNLENWTRVALPSTELDPESRRLFAVDTATVDVTGAAFRFAVVGQVASVSVLRVSKTGAEWAARTNAPNAGADQITALGITATNWIIGTNAAALYYGVVDDGSGVGPVAVNGTAWTLAVGSPVGEPTEFATNGTRVFVLTSTSGAYSDDDGANWTTYSGVTGTARSGNGRSVVYDGSRWVFITQSAQAYNSSDGDSFTYKATFSGTSTVWQLATGVPGEVIAYRYHATDTAGVFCRTTDSGATWSAITPAGPRLPVKVTCLRYASGQWLASSDVAPYLWSSNDLIAWHPLHIPVTGSASFTVGAVAWDGGAWTAVGRSFALQSLRASDEGAATFDGDDGATTLADAGYLHGHELADTAPTDGYVLTWNAADAIWEPAAAGAPTFPSASGAGQILVSPGAGTTFTPQDRLDHGTAIARDAVASPMEGDRWYIDSGSGVGEEWTYRDGAWATTHTATSLRGVALSATLPSVDRQILEYVAATGDWTPLTAWIRKVNGGPQTTDATPTVAVAWTVPVGDYDVEIRVRGRKDAVAQAALWIFNLAVVNLAGTVTVSGAGGGDVEARGPIGDFAALEVGTSTVAIAISGTSLQVVVTGLAATAINWTARLTAY